MASFSTGSSMDNKDTNWNFIKKLFPKTSKIHVDDNLINRVKNEVPNAAFEYLIRLYKKINNKE